MLATQFLNVVLEENDAEITENDEPDEEESNNNTIYDIINQLDIKSQLAKILLAECTIEPSIVAKKREKPVLSFEANVTPIYNVPPKKPKPNDELSLLTSVEAVYSEGEDNDVSDESSPSVPCPVCNRSFSRNCSLALHMKSHEPLDETYRKFQCHFCPRSFTQKSLFKKHLTECVPQSHRPHSPPPPPFIQEHSDGLNPQRRYECQYCHRSYTQKSVLKKHLVVHTGERERCNVCGAGFSQRSSLVRHAKRIHGGLLNHAIGSSTAFTTGMIPGNGIPQNTPQVITSGVHNTPILTTALSNVTHPTLGTPLIVGIPVNQLAKFAGTQFAASAASGNLFRGGKVALPPNVGVPTTKAVPAAIPISSVAAVLANPNLARLSKIQLPKSLVMNNGPLSNNNNNNGSLVNAVKAVNDPVLVASLNKPIDEPAANNPTVKDIKVDEDK